MKTEKTRNVISIIVILIATFCCIMPLLTNKSIPQDTMTSAFGEEVELYGKGLYARNSFSMAIQAIAQDMVTLFLVIPSMIIALVLVKKGKIVAQFVLTGLLGYMLYTYMSYAFLMYYDDLFLLYVLCMTLSFYGFTMSVIMLSKNEIVSVLQENMKTKGIRIFLSLAGLFIAMMWLGRIIPTIGTEKAPIGLDNCSTLGIQVLDLGVIVPACFVISYLLKEKSKLGYVLAPVIIVKAVSLVIAVLAMAVLMTINGESVAIAEFIVFGLIAIVSLYYLLRVLKQISQA